MATHEAQRYNERSAAERFNGRLNEEFGGRNVMVKGAQKVILHLMFGVVSLFADHLENWEHAESSQPTGLLQEAPLSRKECSR